MIEIKKTRKRQLLFMLLHKSFEVWPPVFGPTNDVISFSPLFTPTLTPTAQKTNYRKDIDKKKIEFSSNLIANVCFVVIGTMQIIICGFPDCHAHTQAANAPRSMAAGKNQKMWSAQNSIWCNFTLVN